MRYFAYGSNMASDRLAARVGPTAVIGSAVLDGYRHSFSKFGADGTAKGNIAPDIHGRVWGVVYELSAAQFERLDEVEGGYRRIEVSVQREGESSMAVTYVAIAPQRGLRPAVEYIEHYERGIAEHEIPIEYWDSIRPWSAASGWVVVLTVGAITGAVLGALR